MERYDVSEGARLAEMVEAAERGEDVEIAESGRVVARLTAEPLPVAATPLNGAELVERLEALRRELPPRVFAIDWTGAVRAMRDEERF